MKIMNILMLEGTFFYFEFYNFLTVVILNFSLINRHLLEESGASYTR